MSHTEPGRRRDTGGGLGTLDPEQPTDSRVPLDEAPVPGAVGEGKRSDTDRAASGSNNRQTADGAFTLADLVARIERCSPRWPTGSVLVAGMMGFRVVRTTSPEEAGSPPSGRNDDDAASDGQVHAIWMTL